MENSGILMLIATIAWFGVCFGINALTHGSNDPLFLTGFLVVLAAISVFGWIMDRSCRDVTLLSGTPESLLDMPESLPDLQKLDIIIRNLDMIIRGD